MFHVLSHLNHNKSVISIKFVFLIPFTLEQFADTPAQF